MDLVCGVVFLVADVWTEGMELLTADHKSQWRAQPALKGWEEAERLRCASDMPEDEDENTRWETTFSAARATAPVPTISLGGPGTGIPFHYHMAGTCEVTIDYAHPLVNFGRHYTTHV